MKPEFERFEYTGKIARTLSSFRLYFSQEGWDAVLRVGTIGVGWFFSTDGKYEGEMTLEEAAILLQKLRG